MKPIFVILVLLLTPLKGADAFEFLGPVETLDNGHVVLQVALKIGRIVSYHRKDEANWLAVSDKAPNPTWHWNPWGGDRVWPGVQIFSPQLYGHEGFDPVIDGEPWELVSKTATMLEMKSGISPQLGLQVIRRMELLQKDSTEVLHTIRLVRTAPSDFPVHAWAVTALRKGDYILMESDPSIPHPQKKPFRWWPEFSPERPQASLVPDTAILQVPWPDKNLKLGTYGRWIALVAGNSAFCEVIPYDSKAPYVEASNLQTYLDPVMPIFEIETLSPTWFLKKGEVKEWQVRWKILDFPKKATTLKDRASFLGSETRR